MHRVLKTFFLIIVVSAFQLLNAEENSQRGLLVMSIDGLPPAYVSNADRYGLKIPVLRRLYQEGAHASGVRGVLPTVTYPSHTTMMTGVWPIKHGIFNNVTFDPEGRNAGGWYWYSEDIRVPTLWEVAAKQGYAIASVSWPVSAGSAAIKYDIPEYWRAFSVDDVKLLRAISTPGLLAELQGKLGTYIVDLDNAIPGDWMRTRYTEALIREKHANFVTLHFAALDHLEHEYGPATPEVFAVLEEIDAMVGVLQKAMQETHPGSVVAIVSDHGFARIDRELNPKVAFVKAGLITPNPKKTGLRGPNVTEWKVQVWASGGSASIVLKDPNDSATKEQVHSILKNLSADPANGIERVLMREEILALGGDSNAHFALDMKPGFSVGGSMDGPLVKEIHVAGTHGYVPTHPEMRASFLLAGPSIKKGLDLGEIDMRSFAPTFAKILGIPFPTADLPALEVQPQ